MRKSIKRLAVAAVSLTALLAIAGIATADSYTSGFEQPTFNTGSVDGQGGWKSSGPYDQGIVANGPGVPSTFGAQSLRESNAVTQPEFTNQTYSAPTLVPATESGANQVYDASFDFTSATLAHQPGLRLSVSPDSNEGSRMQYVRLESQPDGIHVFIQDAVLDPNPPGYTFRDIDATPAVGALDPATAHTVEFKIRLVPGPDNDVARVLIDGVDIGDRLGVCFTTWEDYYRLSSEQNQPPNNNNPPSINSLQIRAGSNPAATNPTLGGGYLFDNVSVTTGNTGGPAATTCGLAHDGLVSPTGTTCQQYHDGVAPALVGGLQYSVAKGNTIGSVSPGVFFYFTKVTVKAGGDTVGITQSGAGPAIPIQQVVVYDAASCKVVNRSLAVNNATGTASGPLPAGSYIISVKFSPSDLKGKAAPASPPVTYSLGTTVGGVQFQVDSTVSLALKAK